MCLRMFCNYLDLDAAIVPQEALLLLLRRKLCKGVRVLFHALLHRCELLHAFSHLLKRPFAFKEYLHKNITAQSHDQNVIL